MANSRIHWLITSVNRERHYNVGCDVLQIALRAAHKRGDHYESVSGASFIAVVQANYGGTDALTGRSLDVTGWYGLRFAEVDAHRYVVKALQKLVDPRKGPRADGLDGVVSALRAVFASNEGSEHYWEYRRTDAPSEIVPPLEEKQAEAS